MTPHVKSINYKYYFGFRVILQAQLNQVATTKGQAILKIWKMLLRAVAVGTMEKLVCSPIFL